MPNSMALMATLRRILWPSQPPPPPPPLLSMPGGRPGGPLVRFLVTELLRCVLACTCSCRRCRHGSTEPVGATSSQPLVVAVLLRSAAACRVVVGEAVLEALVGGERAATGRYRRGRPGRLTKLGAHPPARVTHPAAGSGSASSLLGAAGWPKLRRHTAGGCVPGLIVKLSGRSTTMSGPPASRWWKTREGEQPRGASGGRWAARLVSGPSEVQQWSKPGLIGCAVGRLLPCCLMQARCSRAPRGRPPGTLTFRASCSRSLAAAPVAAKVRE